MPFPAGPCPRGWYLWHCECPTRFETPAGYRRSGPPGPHRLVRVVEEVLAQIPGQFVNRGPGVVLFQGLFGRGTDLGVLVDQYAVEFRHRRRSQFGPRSQLHRGLLAHGWIGITERLDD